MKWLILFGTVLSTGCSLIGIRNEEVPNYKVVHTEGAYEIREYETYLIAETTVEGDYDEAPMRVFEGWQGIFLGKTLQGVRSVRDFRPRRYLRENGDDCSCGNGQIPGFFLDHQFRHAIRIQHGNASGPQGPENFHPRNQKPENGSL